MACSGDLLLEALAACAGVTLGAVAPAIGIEIREGTVRAEGDLDFRGTLGVSKETPFAGFNASDFSLILRQMRQKNNSPHYSASPSVTASSTKRFVGLGRFVSRTAQLDRLQPHQHRLLNGPTRSLADLATVPGRS